MRPEDGRTLSRRTLVGATPALGIAALLGSRGVAAARPDDAPADAPERHYGYPAQDRDAVSEVVGASHRNLERVRELVLERPELAKASWDWGFGDWETALGAASHTGRREIALFLLDHGARPTLFSAAMLGQLAVVRGFIEASPGVARIEGPHGIPLLAHARAGGEAALPVVEYLQGVEGAGDRVEDDRPLDAAERERYFGVYAFGEGSEDRFEVTELRGQLAIGCCGGFPRQLVRLSENIFFPRGASSVRVRFRFEASGGVAVEADDGVLTVVGRRVAG